MSRITIRAATEADTTTLVTLGNDAFGFDAVAQAFFPASREPDLAKRLDDDFRWRCDNAKRGLAHPRRDYIVAEETREDGDTEVVGWAGWELLLPPEDEEEKSDEDKRRDFEQIASGWPSSLDVDAMRRYWGVIEEATEGLLGKDGTKGMWTLNSIAVNPKHQRKGIGRRLLNYGIDKAEEQKRDIYLISVEAGRALYLGAGFEQIGSFEALGTPQYQMILKSRKGGTK